MNDDILVNTKRVAREVAGAGEFMMFESEVGRLLVTGQFVLSLTEKNFFSVRCKLEVPELEQWYFYGKDGPIVSERPAEIESWEERYCQWLQCQNYERELSQTGITLGGSILYTNGLTYTAIAESRIHMLASTDTLRLTNKMIVVDDVHVIAAMSEKIWRENGFLYKLPGIDKESEDEK